MSTLAGGNFSLLVTLSVCLFPLFLSVCVCVFWSLLLRDKLLSINYRQSVALLVTTPGSAIASLHISTPFITMMVVPVLVVVVAGRPGGMPDVYPCSRIPRFLCGSSTTRACVCVCVACALPNLLQFVFQFFKLPGFSGLRDLSLVLGPGLSYCVAERHQSSPIIASQSTHDIIAQMWPIVGLVP